MEPSVNDQQFVPPTPVTPAPKNSFNLKKVLYFVVVAIIATGLSGVAVWAFMANQNDSKNKSLNAQITTNNNTIASLKKTVSELNTKVGSTTSTTSTNLTNDQIFQEVSSQLKFIRSNVGYFRIYGQDKVEFSLKNPDTGDYYGNIAYKQNGQWSKFTVGQAVPDCSQVAAIPEIYKPVCIVSNSQTAYMNDKGYSLNYLTSSMVSYIDQ